MYEIEMNIVSLNLLDRDVEVGCLYDYNNAKILPVPLDVFYEDIERIDYLSCLGFFTSDDNLSADITITTDVSVEGRLACIGINKHLSQQLEDQKFDVNRLWFNSYLKDEAFENCNNNEVIIIAYVKVDRRGTRLTDEFISSNIWRYDNNEYGGTHMVINVQYGAEFVLWMRRPIDPFKESKEFLEQTMHIELENYLQKLFNNCYRNESPPIPHKDFDKMTCSLRSCIPSVTLSNGKLEQCIKKIQEFTIPKNIKLNDRLHVWRPVRVEIRRIPTKAEIKTSFNLRDDEILELKQNNQWITQRCNQFIASLFSPRIVFLKKPLLSFQKLLEPMVSKIEKKVDKMQQRYFSTGTNYSDASPYKYLQREALRWLKVYYEDVKTIHSAMEGNSLPVLDLRSIKEKIKDEDSAVKRTKVFVLHFRCVTTGLRKRFKKWAKNPLLNKMEKVFEWDGYDVEWESISKEFQAFVNESLNPVDSNVDYAIGMFLPNSEYEAGAVVTIGYEEILRAVQGTSSGMFLPNTLDLAASESSTDEEDFFAMFRSKKK